MLHIKLKRIEFWGGNMPTIFCKTRTLFKDGALTHWNLPISTRVSKIKPKTDNHVRRYGTFLTRYFMRMQSVRSYTTFNVKQREYDIWLLHAKNYGWEYKRPTGETAFLPDLIPPDLRLCKARSYFLRECTRAWHRSTKDCADAEAFTVFFGVFQIFAKMTLMTESSARWRLHSAALKITFLEPFCTEE